MIATGQYDVLVVGAGPAGAVTARRLAERGLRIAVLERSSLPRYKPCGGGVTGRAAALLPSSLALPIEDTITAIHVHYHPKDVEPIVHHSSKPFVYTVMRDWFDYALVCWAADAGVHVYEDTSVLDIKQSPESVTAITSRGMFSGRFLVGADGASSVVGRRIGFTPNPKRRAIAMELEVEVDERTLSRHRNKAHIELGAIPWGYAWIFPKADHLSIGIGSVKSLVHRKELYELIHAFLERHHIDGVVRRSRAWWIPVAGAVNSLTYGNVLLVGDAAGLADPLLGEGIYYAIWSADIAAEVLAGVLKGDYERPMVYHYRVAHEIWPQLRALEAVSRVCYTYPATAFSLLHRYPAVVNALIGILAGTEDHAMLMLRLQRFFDVRFAKFVIENLKS